MLKNFLHIADPMPDLEEIPPNEPLIMDPLPAPVWPTQMPEDPCTDFWKIIKRLKSVNDKFTHLQKMQSGQLFYLGLRRASLKKRKFLFPPYRS